MSRPTLLVTPNLSSKNVSAIFHLLSTLDSQFFKGRVWVPTFLGHAKFEVKNFFRIFFFTDCSGLNLSEGTLGQLFLVTPNLNQKIFNIFLFRECSGFWIFHRGVWANFLWSQQFWDPKIFLEFFTYRALWTLNFSEGVFWAIFFGHIKFVIKKSFVIFSFTKNSRLWIFQNKIWAPTFFGSREIWGQKIFQNFFIYWVLWSLNFSERESGLQLFGSH